MVFNKGDVVRPLEDLNCYNKKSIIKHNLTEEEMKRFSSEMIPYYIAITINLKVLGYGVAKIYNEKCLVLLVEDEDTKGIFAINEKLVTCEGNWKIYNIPDYIDKEINQIAIRGRMIKVTLKDGSVGTALCRNTDVFDEEKGVRIAVLRAKANSIEDYDIREQSGE